MRTPPDTPRSERGTAAVEFALVLPLVLVVALALVQTGLLVRDRLLVEAAGRAGGRAAPGPKGTIGSRAGVDRAVARRDRGRPRRARRCPGACPSIGHRAGGVRGRLRGPKRCPARV